MIKLADDQDPDVLIPLIPEVVEVEVQAVVVGIDVGHVAIIATVLELAVILCKRSSRTPPFEYSQG